MMRMKVTLEVIWSTTACVEKNCGASVVPVSVARSMNQQPECNGYTTVPLGELAGLF